MVVVLDTGVLGLLLHPSASPAVRQVSEWAEAILFAGRRLCIPGIADYELRRELIRAGKETSIRRLDEARQDFEFLPITQRDLDDAAGLWAQARLQHRPSASDTDLDADMILCAQVRGLQASESQIVVATTNVGHLERFVDARTIDDIK